MRRRQSQPFGIRAPARHLQYVCHESRDFAIYGSGRESLPVCLSCGVPCAGVFKRTLSGGELLARRHATALLSLM